MTTERDGQRCPVCMGSCKSNHCAQAVISHSTVSHVNFCDFEKPCPVHDEPPQQQAEPRAEPAGVPEREIAAIRDRLDGAYEAANRRGGMSPRAAVVAQDIERLLAIVSAATLRAERAEKHLKGALAKCGSYMKRLAAEMERADAAEGVLAGAKREGWDEAIAVLEGVKSFGKSDSAEVRRVFRKDLLQQLRRKAPAALRTAALAAPAATVEPTICKWIYLCDCKCHEPHKSEPHPTSTAAGNVQSDDRDKSRS